MKLSKTYLLLVLAVLTFSCSSNNSKTVSIGDKIELFGSKYGDPKYLQNPPAKSRTGTVVDFINSERKISLAVVQLDTSIIGDSVTGNFAVLARLYEDQEWNYDGPVHIEICNTKPEPDENGKRDLGEWIELSASYRLIGK